MKSKLLSNMKRSLLVGLQVAMMSCWVGIFTVRGEENLESGEVNNQEVGVAFDFSGWMEKVNEDENLIERLMAYKKDNNLTWLDKRTLIGLLVGEEGNCNEFMNEGLDVEWLRFIVDVNDRVITAENKDIYGGEGLEGMLEEEQNAIKVYREIRDEQVMSYFSEEVMKAEVVAWFRGVIMNWTSVVKVLVKEEGSVEKKNLNEMTGLQFAAKLGYMDMVEILVDKGANIEAVNLDNMTATEYAMREKHFAIAKFLMAKLLNEKDEVRNAEELKEERKPGELVKEVLKDAGKAIENGAKSVVNKIKSWGKKHKF